MSRRKDEREWPGASDEAMREHVRERTGHPDEDPGTMEEREHAQNEGSEEEASPGPAARPE